MPHGQVVNQSPSAHALAGLQTIQLVSFQVMPIRNTEEKIKIYGGFVLMGLLLMAFVYPQASLCLGFVFVMLVAWVLQLLSGPRSRR